MEKKEIVLLSMIMCILFLGQLYIADRVLFGDDYIFATLADENRFFFTENAHPPLPVWSDIIITEILPLTNRTMRLTSIIFATLTTLLVYFITRKIANQKTAIIAAMIVGFSAWHIRASQMNSGSDGGMFTFFFYLTTYFFMRALETEGTKEKIATGIAFGLTMLSKETGVLLIPICGIYYCYVVWKRKRETNNSIKKEITIGVRNALMIFFVALLVWSIFPILDMVYNEGQSIHAIIERIDTVVIEKEASNRYDYWFMTLFSIFKLLIWTGPLLLLLSFLSITSKKEWKEEGIFVILIIVSVLFYLIITPPNLDRTRYLMITIPALAMVSAKYITIKTEEYRFGKKEWTIIGALSMSIFITFLIINQNVIVVSYEGQENPIALLKQGNLNFSIPVFTETDNSGFLLHFTIFIGSYVIAGICACFLLFGNNFSRKVALIVLLSVGLGYNVIVAEEYGLHWTSPNYSDGIKEVVSHAESKPLQEPLYILKNYELQWYLREEYTQYNLEYGISEIDAVKIGEFRQKLENDGSIIFTNMPPIDKNGLLWKMINENCVTEYTVVDKDIEMGWIFSC